MTFPRRKRTASSANPFGRKLSAEDVSARDAPRSVQQSLFSAIRRAGYDGSAASSIAWRLIKAVRPKMAESALSLSQVSRVPREELTEIRACVVASSERESMAGEPARAELVGDIIAMLDGILARSLAAPLALVGAVPPAPARAVDDDVEARQSRLIDRYTELVAGGAAPDDAMVMARAEVEASS